MTHHLIGRRFSLTASNGLQFDSALWHTEEEWAVIDATEGAEAAEQQAQFDAWLAALVPPAISEPTPEELAAQLADLEAQRDALNAQIAELEAQLGGG